MLAKKIKIWDVWVLKCVQVKIEQGVKVIKIFKEHESKTSILDDFVFYESREKIIKEGKKKHQLYKKQVNRIKTLKLCALSKINKYI